MNTAPHHLIDLLTTRKGNSKLVTTYDALRGYQDKPDDIVTNPNYNGPYNGVGGYGMDDGVKKSCGDVKSDVDRTTTSSNSVTTRRGYGRGYGRDESDGKSDADRTTTSQRLKSKIVLEF